MTKIAAKKIENVSSIFLAKIFVTQFPLSQSQDPQIRDIASSSNIFENLKFSKMFDEDAISPIRGYYDCDRGAGGGDDKNCGQKKIENYEVGRLFFDVYQHLAEPDDKADWLRSTR